MARTLDDSRLRNRTERARLPPRKKPYYRAMDIGLHLGYTRHAKTSGVWSLRFYLGNQRYVSEKIGVADDYGDPNGLTVLSFSQAQARARERATTLAQISAGLAGRREKYTVQMALDDYFVWLEQHRKSAPDARQRAAALISPPLGEFDTAKLTSVVLRHWLHALAAAPARLRSGAGRQQRYKALDDDPDAQRRRKATANRTLTILKAALNRAHQDGFIASADAWQRVKPFPAADAARLRFLTLDEARRLLAACPPDFRALVDLALATGARYGELIRLLVGDYDAAAGALHVRESKSEHGRRIVLTDEGSALAARLAQGRPADERLLLRVDGCPWDRAHQQRPMAAACKLAGIDPPMSFHGLRHTYASLAVMGGLPPVVLAANLGHSSTRMVEKHYGHLAESFISDAIRTKAPRFNPETGVRIVALRRQPT